MSKIKLYLLLIVIYTLIAIIFTWPTALHPHTTIYGYPGDSFGTIWRMWWYRTSQIQSDFSYNSNLAAPFGTYFSKEATPVLYFGTLKLASYLSSEVLAYNLIIFFSFVLTPLFTFLLLEYLTKNRLAAFIGSLIFNLAPYHFWHAFNHPDLAQMQWMPLYVLAFLHLEKKKTVGAAFLAAVAYFLVAYTSFYYGYFLFLFTMIFLIFKISLEVLTHQPIKQRFFAYLVFGLTILAFLIPIIKPALFSDLYEEVFSSARAERTVNGLVGVSTRPWDYVLPSTNHPFLGKYSQQIYEWLKARLSKAKASSDFVQERTVYLGLINLILALVGFFSWLKTKKIQDYHLPIFLLTAITLVIISGPPFVRIFGITINLPSSYFFSLKIFKGFRVYSRLGVVVLLCVTILASYGAKYIFETLKKKFLLPISCFLLLSFLIIFDFLNFPPFNVTDVGTTPQCYQWLANQPGDFIIVEYPDLYAYTDALLFQRIHQKKLFNLMGGDLHDAIWPLVAEADNPDSIDHLRTFGVKYLFVHTKNIFPPDELDHIRYMRVTSPLDLEREPNNLEISKRCPEGIIYKIKDFSPKDKIYVINEKINDWFPKGNWELEERVNHLLIANATGETKTMHLLFDAGDDLNKLEINIINKDGKIIKVIDNIVRIFPGITRVKISNKGSSKVILKNLRLSGI